PHAELWAHQALTGARSKNIPKRLANALLPIGGRPTTVGVHSVEAEGHKAQTHAEAPPAAGFGNASLHRNGILKNTQGIQKKMMFKRKSMTNNKIKAQIVMEGRLKANIQHKLNVSPFPSANSSPLPTRRIPKSLR